MMDNIAIFCAKYLIFLIPIVYAWLIYKAPKKKRIEMIIAAVAAAATAFILSKLAGSIHDNPRPFVSDGTPALINHGNDNGFPSEHSLMASTIVTLVFFYGRQLFWLCLAAAILVAWGRVFVHVHHGIDILAGLAIGAVAGWLGCWVTKKILDSKKIVPEQETKKVN